MEYMECNVRKTARRLAYIQIGDQEIHMSGSILRFRLKNFP